MADILTGVGVNDQDAAVSVAVGNVQAVGCGIDHHVRRLIEQRRVIDTAMRVVAVWSPWSSADPHLEIAVPIELQYKAVAAFLVRRPRRPSPARGPLPAARRGISRDPDVVVLVDINTVLGAWPDAACLRLAFTADETGIGRTAPGAQQLAIGIELQNCRSGFAAIRDGAIRAHLAKPVDWLALLLSLIHI